MRGREIVFLFVLGAVAGLAGDAANVQSSVTRYLPDAGPIIWKSAWWFPVLVGIGTVATGFTRLRLAPARREFDVRIGVSAVAAVLAIYAVSSIGFGIEHNDSIAKVLLCTAMAVLVASWIADVPGLICGAIAAVIGPAVEIAIVNLDLSTYSIWNDGLFGVALWLPPLYFAFGVAVARITELLRVSRLP